MIEVAEIKLNTFNIFRTSRRVWIVEERGAEFVVHKWSDAGVAPPSTYPSLRKATARLLQLLAIGPVAPQTWPEHIGIGEVTTGKEAAGTHLRAAAQDVADLSERLRDTDGSPAICIEAADDLDKKDAEIKRLRNALELIAGNTTDRLQELQARNALREDVVRLPSHPT